MNFKTMADKDNAVADRVATVPLDLVVGNYKTFSAVDVRTSESFVVAFVSDDGDIHYPKS
jgi:hypothetical protein